MDRKSMPPWRAPRRPRFIMSGLPTSSAHMPSDRPSAVDLILLANEFAPTAARPTDRTDTKRREPRDSAMVTRHHEGAE